MKVVNITYWVSTGLLVLMMAGSAYTYFTSPDMVTAFQHLGFPSYFRQQLGVFKILGVVALLAPVPARVKEWAYFGFFIVLVSALVAHFTLGDPAQATAGPIMGLGLLGVSYFSYHRRERGGVEAAPAFALVTAK